METATPIEAILKRDRVVVIAGVVAVAALAWAYMVYLGQSINGMDMGMAQLQSWTATDFGLMFLMWAVMMTGMMVPSAAPMILLFATVNRKRREQQVPICLHWDFSVRVRACVERVRRGGHVGQLGPPR